MATPVRVMVVGASGMLGQGVVSVLETDPRIALTLVTRENFDVTEADLDAPCTRGHEFVINCVGAIPQRQPPYTSGEMWELNCDFPKSLADRCATRGSHLIHVTTDCKYSGSKLFPEVYCEDDPCDAQDDYGRSKAAPEQVLVDKGVLVVRTSIVGRNRNRPTGLFEWFRDRVTKGRDNLPVPGFVNHWWNGVTTREFGRVCQQVIHARECWTPDLVHLFSPGPPVSKYQLLRMFARTLGLDPDVTVTPVTSESTVNRALGTHKTFCSRMGVRDLQDQVEHDLHV